MPQWHGIPDWFSWENQGAGIALADLHGNGSTDLVVFMVDAPEGANRGVYCIGRGLDGDGVVSGGWTPWLEVPDWFSWENQGAGVAVIALTEPEHTTEPHHHHHGADPHDHHTDPESDGSAGENEPQAEVLGIVVAQVDAPEQQNQGFYRIGRHLDADGGVHGGWSSWLGVPDWFSWDNHGIDIASVPDGDEPRLCILLVDNAEGQNSAHYQLMPVAPDPPTEGVWEELPYLSQVLGVHGAVLPTGDVLFFAGSGSSKVRFESDAFGDVARGVASSVVWNPLDPSPDGDFFHPPNLDDAQGKPIDFFCCGHAFLPDGTMLAAGGTLGYPNGQGFLGRVEVMTFDGEQRSWQLRAPMSHGRWYPTLVTLADGTVLAVSGAIETGHPANPAIERYHPDTDTWETLPVPDAPALLPLPLYAHLFQVADGRVVFVGGRVDDPSPVGPSILDLSQAPITVTPLAGLRAADTRQQAASVLLPPAQDQKLLIIGGGPVDQSNATDAVDLLDLTQTDPHFHPAASMTLPRMHHNAVLLPDRTVLVCGGSLQREARVVGRLQAEIYDPAADTWRIGAASTIPRLYHSIALLLPDGRVVAAGGNPEGGEQDVWIPPDEREELRLDVYSPPYLFRGPRPVIDQAPTTATHGERLTLATSAAPTLRWVSLIRPGITTHAFDSSQRLVDLEVVHQTADSVDVQVPANPNITPPGWYMLFLTDQDGVPSIARWIQVVASVG
jgi:hypothetical protein